MRRLFIMRKDLNMSPGKLAVQIAHCAEAYWTRWIAHHLTGECAGDCYEVHGYINPYEEEYISGVFIKTICEAKNKNHLLKNMGLSKMRTTGLSATTV